MSRFFVQEENIGSSTIEVTDPGDLRHMMKVLRMKPGDEVDISDMVRFEYRAKIETLDKDGAVLTIIDKQGFSTEPDTRVTLYQGIPKQGKMESIIQKCVELGVMEIVPVFTERTVVVDRGGNMAKKVDRWNKVSAEAVKQCRRGLVPKVRDPITMDQVVDEIRAENAGEDLPEGYDLILIPYENEEGKSIKQVLRNEDCLKDTEAEDGRKIAVIIGPEGGFTEEEVEKVIEAGGHSVTLGKTTLRTETAGPAALAMILYELELN